MGSGQPDTLFEACDLIGASTRRGFERTIASATQGPRPQSFAAFDAAFSDESWPPNVGEWPIGASTLLLSGANSVLADLGALIGAARGPVTAPALCRYVVEHMAEVLWLLGPGPNKASKRAADPGHEAPQDAQARAARIRRAAVTRYRWTIEFEKGRRRPDQDHPPKLPGYSSADLQEWLRPHGLTSSRGRRWRLGEVEEPSMTKKVETLANEILTRPAPLYGALSTSVHPNPFAISEVGGSGEFVLSAPQMARMMGIAAKAFAGGWGLVTTYAGWDLTDVDQLNERLRDLVLGIEAQESTA